jgi:hypothetical protein
VFGTTVVSPGAVVLTLGSITSAEAFGAISLSPGAVSVTGIGAIASAEALGTVTVAPGAVDISGVGGCATSEAFGALVLSPGAVAVILTGIDSAEAFGTAVVTHVVVFTQTLTGFGIASAETFGITSLTPGPVTLSLSAIHTAEAWGVLRLLRINPKTLVQVQMDGLALLMGGIDNIVNAYAWPAPSITTPCAIVGYPKVSFDETMARGADEMTYPVWLVMGGSTRKAWQDMGEALDAVKALDGGYPWGDIRIASAKVQNVTVGSVVALAAQVNVDVVG